MGTGSVAIGSSLAANSVGGCRGRLRLAVASVGAVAALAPLKTVEPFVIRVDSATGIVDTVSALRATARRYNGDWNRRVGL